MDELFAGAEGIRAAGEQLVDDRAHRDVELLRTHDPVYEAARRIQSRSAPALKDLPSPARTMTRTLSSSPSERKASCNWPMMCSLKALWTSGRAIVTLATGPSTVSFRYSPIF